MAPSRGHMTLTKLGCLLYVNSVEGSVFANNNDNTNNKKRHNHDWDRQTKDKLKIDRQTTLRLGGSSKVVDCHLLRVIGCICSEIPLLFSSTLTLISDLNIQQASCDCLFQRIILIGLPLVVKAGILCISIEITLLS